MALGSDGSVSIDVIPDGSEFIVSLDKILRAAEKQAKIEVNVKPDISGLASELKKASKSTEANLSIGIKAEFTKSSLADLKTSVKAQFDGFSTKVGSQTYTIKPNIELDVRFTESSLKKLKTSINNTFKTVERDAEGKATKITSPIDLTAEFTQKSLNKLKADVKNTFKRTVEKDNGKTTKVVSPIDLQAKFTQGSLAQLKRDVSNTFKKTITNADGSTTKVAIPIKITPELSKFSKENIALVKAKLLQDFGVVKLPVVAVQGVNKVGSIGSGVNPVPSNAVKGAGANLDKVSQSTRNLGRDLTVLGRAATEGKSSIFSFLGAISPGQVAITALSTGVIQGTKAFIKFGLTSAKSVEQVTLAFENFLGSGAKASALIDQLQNFAAVTPFDLDSLLKSSRILLGSGVQAKDLVSTLRDVAGVGAQLGVTGTAIDRVVNTLAKIKGQGKVTQRELRSIFTAFPGFIPIKAIAENISTFNTVNKQTGETVPNTQKALKAISKGSVDADSAIKALLKGMREFPGAADALYKQSLTLAGSQETLRDRLQQVARAAVDPALPQLAASYREAAQIFFKQSKDTNITSGISNLIKESSTLVPVLAKLAVPAINAFTSALTPLVPIIKDFFDTNGDALLEVLKAGFKILPAFANGLGAVLTVLKPLTPIIEVFAKAIQAIPAPAIAAAGALKLLGSGGGLIGGLLGKGASKFNPKSLFTGINDGLNTTEKLAQSAGSKITGLGKSISTSFNINGLKQYSRELQSLTEKQRAFQNSPIRTSDGSFFGKSPVVEARIIGKEIDGLTAKGVTFGQKVKGSLNSAVSGIGSLLSNIGPQLALTAATIGVGILIEKYQQAKAEARKLGQEAKLIGAELSLNTTAGTSSARSSTIIAKIQTDTELGKKAIEDLNKGAGKVNSKALDTFFSNGSHKAQEYSKDLAGLGQELSGPVTTARITKIITSTKEYDRALKALNQSGNIAIVTGTGSGEAADKAIANLKKVRQEYLDSATDTVSANQLLAKDLGRDDLAKIFAKQGKDLAKNKDVGKNYLDFRKSTLELSIAQSSLKDEAILAGLGLTEESDALKAAGGAAAIAGGEIDGLTQATNDLIIAQGDISADNILASFDPKTISNFAAQFRGLEGTSQQDFVNQLLGQFTDVTGSTEAAKTIVSQITGFKNTVIGEIYKTRDEIAAAIPSINDAFKTDFKFEIGGISAETLKANLQAYVDGLKSFGANINKLGGEFPDLAQKIAALGPAVGGQLAKDLANNPALAQQIRESLASAETTFGTYTTDVTGIIQTNYEKINGFSPGELSIPGFTINTPTQGDIDTTAAQLADVTTRIEAKRDELIAKNKTLKRFGEPTVNVDQQLQNNPLLTEAFAEQERLQAKLDELQTTVFTNTTKQAATTATAVNTTFANAKIDEAVKPQLDNVVTDIKAIPTEIKGVNKEIATALTSDPFAFIAPGISIGTQLGQGVDVGFTAVITASSEVWKASFTTIGTQLANALSASFTTGLASLPEALLAPFRTTRIPLNSYLATLNSLSSVLGLKGLFPQIPVFHSGGIVGEKSDTHKGGSLKSDERAAILQKGEGVLPKSTMLKLGKGQFEMLRKGDGLGKSSESASSFNSDASRTSINAARNAYLALNSNGVPIQNMADAVVNKFADAVIKFLDSKSAALSFGNGALGVISSGKVVESLIAAKGKFGSYKTLIQAMNGSGLGFGVSSTYRPGAITVSGNASLHGAGRAVDFVGSKQQMLAMARWWTQYAPYLAELIHTPLGFGVKNGKRAQYPFNVLKGHYDHGHVALYRGGLVKGSMAGIIANIGERGQSELVMPLGQPGRMAQLISYASRTGDLTPSGQKAIAQALSSNNTTNSNNNSPTLEAGAIQVTVESHTSDPGLQGDIIATRIMSKLRSL